MSSPEMPGRRGGVPAAGEDTQRAEIALEAMEVESNHDLLKACFEDVGWRDAGKPCDPPEWKPNRSVPITVTLGESLRVTLSLRANAPARPKIRGVGPGALRFSRDDVTLAAGQNKVSFISTRPLPRRIEKVDLGIRWSATTGETLSPDLTNNVAYVIMNRPRDDQESMFAEDGVTLKRMDRAVSWVAPMRTLDPHTIVRGLMRKFPFYALKPSPKVPRRFHHPTYFNQEGGAWAMSDYPGESGECQAIVRLVRGMLRQLGMPGEARSLLVWGDPDVNLGRQAMTAYWDEDPNAGLSKSRIVNGRRWVAALVDSPVVEGMEYPASHTPVNGVPSPGLNRYEACLEFTYNGTTLLYGGGAGIFRNREDVLRAFWALIWVSDAPNEGFRVEQILTRY
jgi:hypothetical protein